MKKPLSFGMTMLASALGVLIVSVVGGLLMMLMMIGMVAAVGSMGKSEPATVRQGTFLTVDLGRIKGDRSPDQLSLSFGEAKSVGLIEAVESVRRAATDDRVLGIYIKDNGSPSVSWASMEELREALNEFREAGKPVVSYASAYSQMGYYVASCGDVVGLHPAGMVDWRGMGAQVMYYKDLLDKLGVEMQLIRPESCAYKSAGEVYALNHMSEANREQIRTYIGSIWHAAVADVAASRKMSEEELNRLADNLSAYMADDAFKAGVVDTLCFEEDVRKLIKSQFGAGCLLPIEKYAAAKSSALTSGNRVAVIYAEGNVMEGYASGFSDGVYGDDIVKALRQAVADDGVKAIVLRINSPGGAATASESMTHAVMAAKAKKPVVVSMGDLAASAGYEMSCMADVIVAHPMTITGSIGVFGTVPNMGKLMQQKLGLHADTVNTNRNSTAMSYCWPLNSTAKALMMRNVEDFYKTFVGRVAEGRGMTYDQVHQIARGRVWTGADAIEIGLVDTLGGLDLAIRIAAERAGVEKYTVVDMPRKKDAWTQLSELFGNGSTDDLNLLTKVRLARMWNRHKSEYQTLSRIEQDLLYVSSSDGIQARLPFVLIAE